MKLDIDFSLALNDRTGKLFLGQDIIQALGSRVASIRYGRFKRFPRTDLLRRVAGRLTHDETKARVFWKNFISPMPRLRSEKPTLHLDPLSVVRHKLGPQDIVLCHDVGPITHPAYFAPGVNALYAQAYDEIRSARPHMTFVSETTRREFQTLYGDDYPSLTVIYIPVRPGVSSGEERPVAKVRKPFLLTVGSIGDRKNQLRSIQAFALSGLAEIGWQYVLIGGCEPGAEAALELGQRTPGVILPGYANEAELRWLYRNAQGFVLMSLLEGFGMPIIEAAKHGLVSLVSDSGILREIGGPAVLVAEPFDPEHIGEGMTRLAKLSDTERAARAVQATKHLKSFAREPILQQWRDLVDRVTSHAA